MIIVRGFLILLLVSAFFIGTNPTAGAADSPSDKVSPLADSWVADSKTGCQIGWVSGSYNVTAASWSGSSVDGKAEGKGALTVTIRNKDGKELQGQGDAEMKAGKLDGKASLKWSSGDSYDGYYKSGRCEGKGVYKFPNGDTYDGDWKNGKMEGTGIYKKPDGGYSKGEWKSSVMDGKGEIHWANGQINIGDFKNGWAEGKGIIKYSNGNTYEGDIVKGNPAGKGVLKDPSGKVIYEGERGNTPGGTAEQY